MDIWQTARPDVNEPTGWLGRYLAGRRCEDDRLLPRGQHRQRPAAHALDRDDGGALDRQRGQLPVPHRWALQTATGRRNSTPSTQICADEPRAGQRRIRAPGRAGGAGQQHAVAAGGGPLRARRSPIPTTRSPRGCKLIAKVIAADVGTRVFYISLGGFDTHAAAGAHPYATAAIPRRGAGRLLPGSGPAGQGRPGAGDDLLRVRAPGGRERQPGHRPRHGAAHVPGRRPGPGRLLRHPARPDQPARTATSPTSWTSAASTPASCKPGWAWTPPASLTAPGRRSTSCSPAPAEPRSTGPPARAGGRLAQRISAANKRGEPCAGSHRHRTKYSPVQWRVYSLFGVKQMKIVK